MRKLKVTYDDVVKHYADFGYTILTSREDFINTNATHLEYKCSQGHSHHGRYVAKGDKIRCPYCSDRMFDRNRVINDFTKRGFKVTSSLSERVTSTEHIDYICDEGHSHQTTYYVMKKGRGCAYCSNRKVFFKDIKTSFENDGYTLLITEEEYVNARTHLPYICPKGHKHSITLYNWKTGKRCPYCSGRDRKTFEVVSKSFKLEGYTLLTDVYIDCRQYMPYVCPKGHHHKTTWTNWQSDSRCPYCLRSRGEEEVFNLVSKEVECLSRDRTQILNPITGNYFELDIWIPTLRKAIEFNGDYWHGKVKAKHHDKFKIDECKRLGIELLVITDTQWTNNKEDCIETIMRFITED